MSDKVVINGGASMDLSSPMRSVIPSAHGAVLVVLARAGEPLSGRQVAQLTNGQVGQARANAVLGLLADAGLVLREEHPPAKSYRLNRDHVAAGAIAMLADQWVLLIGRIQDHLAEWEPAPVSACLFGSAARGEAGPDSDIDLLLVPPGEVGELATAELSWQAQVEDLTERIRLWSGNVCDVLELTQQELEDAVVRDDRLVRDLSSDAIPLQGQDIRTLLRVKQR